MTRKIRIFLSHRTADKPVIEALAERLLAEGDIEPWFDKWNLVPGQPWQQSIEDEIKHCDCCAVFIGARNADQEGFG